jgi:hypothetical protein
MSNDTVPASATAIPNDLARQFIAKLRAHGHRPYVDNGHFCIRPSVLPRIEPQEPHPLGYSYLLGFDDRPFAALLRDPSRRGELIAAVREAEALADHVSGLDQ